MNKWMIVLINILVCISLAIVFTACDDSDDSEDNDDEGPSGGDAPVRYGWVTGMPKDGNATILHTKDGGKTWELKSEGVSPVSYSDVSAPDKHTAWVVGQSDDQGYGTIYHTTDKGKTWQREGNKQDLLGKDLNGVYAVDTSTAWAVGMHGLILKTTDGGSNWSVQTSNQIPDVPLFKVHAANSQAAWVIGEIDPIAGQATVLRTNDGGDQWIRPDFIDDDGLGAIDVNAIDAMTAWVVGPNNYNPDEGHVHLTLDGGESWQNANLPIAFYHTNGICAFDASTAYVATDQGASYYTENGGEDWIDISPKVKDVPGIKGFELMGVSTKDGQSIWIAGQEAGSLDGCIIHTTDGGTTWAKQDIPVSKANLYYVSFVGACK